ncbi:MULTISPECIES: type II secretion system ATPase GspE [Luteimonas]|uniref:type II secretion system ATPase GspE n=1 Tax=Luteimonas TaxID=83614 RepID=UPI000C7D9FE8|nr:MULTISPECIES: type II secretion system ATPase GspE [Luteimonas]
MTGAVPTIAYGFAKRHGVMLVDAGAPLRVALRDGSDPMALVELRRVLGATFDVETLPAGVFDRRLSEVYADTALGNAAGVGSMDLHGNLDSLVEDLPSTADLLESQGDAPIIRLINGVIAEAVRLGASDVHLESFESALRVRFRVDGVMREAVSLPARIAPLLVSRVKVMARLDIAEKRIPQDGRVSLAMGAKVLDVRVSTLPTRGGERVVLRILDKEQGTLTLPQLGMAGPVLDAMRTALRVPNGIIMVTGPTGSGKTTTLYAALAALNDGERNILTVEDPVEYAIDGVGQTQVNTRVGMSFAAGLRAILRQDPDVLMVGEIRDGETAQVAVQASLTGHLVLSTVHTNDAAGAITRLRDIGIEPFLLASSLRLVVAQRLLRKLCLHCRRPRAAEDAVNALAAGLPQGVLYDATGCPQCNHTGYAGRLGIHEVIVIDERVRRLIADDAGEDAIAQAAFAGGGRLADAARQCVADGLTTLEEAVRVTRQETDGDGIV